jgi:Lantibiotic biosynthesis dehydratase C-term
VHVFYASNPNPLLTECVAPLVARLREQGLIRRYFFIKYWQEGPHVRLRLLPTTSGDAPAVRARVEAALDEFLRVRPSLFEVDPDLLGSFHRDMYVFEYGEEAWERDYGGAGMPIRPNNSYAYMPYEPEHDRYGGEVGVAVAEWHFEHSSDMVLRLLASANVHVRTVMFGLSAQLALVLGYTFRPDPGALALFLRYYGEFWETAQGAAPGVRVEDFDRKYAEMAVPLRRRVAGIRGSVLDGDGAGLASFARDWAEHCRQLRDLIVDLSVAGRMVLVSRADPTRREPMTDPDVLLGILLSGYIHMTNNRLGVGVSDEAYLAHVLRRAVLENELAP